MQKSKNYKAAVRPSDLEPYSCHEHLGSKKVERFDSPCRISIISRRHRLADADGVSCKYAVDGLVLCGILQDDAPEFVKEVSYSQEKITKGEIEETILTLTWE